MTSTIKIRIDFAGVEIIDRTGEMLCGITEDEAIELYLALKKNLKKLKALAAKNK